MRRTLLLAPALALALAAGAALHGASAAGTDTGPAYTPSDANAGATPMADDGVYKAFHEKAGLDRITRTLVKTYKSDPRIKDIFAAADETRLQGLLSEQFCYILGGPCHYSGRDMKQAHADMGLQTADFNALVEDLEAAMDEERVPVWAQNKLLAKLAPIKRDIVTR